MTATAPATCRMSVDASALLEAIGECERLLSELAESGLDLGHGRDKPSTVDLNRLVASRPVETTIRFEPSAAFLRLLATLRARDVALVRVEIEGHSTGSIGGVRVPMVADGDRAGNDLGPEGEEVG